MRTSAPDFNPIVLSKQKSLLTLSIHFKDYAEAVFSISASTWTAWSLQWKYSFAANDVSWNSAVVATALGNFNEWQ